MGRLLRLCGHEVTTASDVKSALQLGEADRFDLLVSDLGLPDGSGLDIIRALKAKHASAASPSAASAPTRTCNAAMKPASNATSPSPSTWNCWKGPFGS